MAAVSAQQPGVRSRLEDYREPAPNGYRRKQTYSDTDNFNLVAFPKISIKVKDCCRRSRLRRSGVRNDHLTTFGGAASAAESPKNADCGLRNLE
jgi:hypothetical protein